MRDQRYGKWEDQDTQRHTVKCENCGESWDETTTGYTEACEMLMSSFGSECPSCEHENN